MQLPAARGPLSALVIAWLRGQKRPEAAHAECLLDALPSDGSLCDNDDAQLALWVFYELHYLGFEDVDDDWEWEPETLRVRRRLEAAFEAELRRRTEPLTPQIDDADDVAQALFEHIEGFESPPMSRFLHREATREQTLEFLIQRSIYHLKESDPHSFVIPRLTGKPKVVLVELQYDEYGAGRPERLHSAMFGVTLDQCGLDNRYGAYIDQVPAQTLAVNNAMSLFGLNRRLRAAAMGHLGAFEATSSLPCRRYAGGLRRLGFSDRAAEYFDEHVEADAVHEQLAIRDICAELADDAVLRRDVFFGATVCMYLDSLAAEQMLSAWASHTSSLRPTMPLTEAVGA